MTEDLLALVDWIKQHGCTHVAMESTGSYWKPVYNLLEMEVIETLVVNVCHIKKICRGVKRTSKMRNGLPVCFGTACCKAVTFQTGISGNCGN